ncbi:hypothetical protein N4R57_04645 [Rhodobacteraceae bacterium D3-12]|nr:hypothetical protein N4R57_04645 [Rhodobacteraceae bacterium D3-12]
MVKVNPEIAEENGRALADAADLVGRRFGLSAIGPAKVAKLAELTTGAVYARFKSRNDLAAAGIEAGFTRVIEWMTQFETAEHYCREVRTYGQRPEGELWCPAMSYAAEVNSASKVEKDAFGKGLALMIAAMRQWPDVSSDAEALHLLGQLSGELTIQRAFRTTNLT